MINAKITNAGKGTVELELPSRSYLLERELTSIGIKKEMRDIKPDETQDGISVQYSADSDIWSHILKLFPKDIDLESANKAVEAIGNAHMIVLEGMEQDLLYDQYESLSDIAKDIHETAVEISGVHETYYFPLAGQLSEAEYGGELTVGPGDILAHADLIQEKFDDHLGGDNMAAYFWEYRKAPGLDNLLLANWGFEELNNELYGKVDVYLLEPMTVEEETALRDWIRGQNSDGLGENFEQQPIELNEGELYVSFWNSGPDYFIKNKEEMDEYLGMTGQQMGGM